MTRRARKKFRLRPLLRSLHRDAGYLAVGLTLVYALSGLAVNHIKDWDPNFQQYERTHALPAELLRTDTASLPSPGAAEPATDAESDAAPLDDLAPGLDAGASVVDRRLAERVLAHLGHDEDPRDVYRATDTLLEIVLDDATLHVDTKTGVVHEEGQKPRFLLRAANWLHLNRGKKAWTFVADGYAAFLLFLAISGIFMLPGRSRVIGRRGLLVTAGALVPVLYVTLSGGP